MKSISGKHFAKLIERRGWTLARINGSHHIYTKEGSYARISVPIHANQSLKLGLLKSLMVIAEIEENEL